MARKATFSGLLRVTTQSIARAQREAERQQRRAQIEAQRQRREYERQQKQQAKEDKLSYLAQREDEVEALNEELQEKIAMLRGILEQTFNVDDRINFEDLKAKERFPSFVTPTELAPKNPPLPPVEFPLSFLQRLVPGAQSKHERQVEDERKKYESELQAFNKVEEAKKSRLESARNQHEQEKNAFRERQKAQHEEIEQFKESYYAGDREAVIAYNDMVLERSSYPDDFPQQFRVGYSVESKELVIEYIFPTLDIVPEHSEFKYVKSKDAIEAKPRKQADANTLYQEIIAAITLRTLHEIFEADQADRLAVATFTGKIDTIDPATGREVSVPVVSVRVSKQEFESLNLAQVQKIACLKSLGAQVSRHPEELQPVKPIIEFNMVDKRFIEQSDLLSGLESRPNLLEMTPGEFEHLVANLFAKMGLETKLTRSSRDGGVDAVAFDARPVLGGKVVIQAKRYSNTVGVSAVRDLYGTIMNEGASKGILVTTSGYGADAFTFAKGKPIELIDGSGLLHLLFENGYKARIVPIASQEATRPVLAPSPPPPPTSRGIFG